MINTRDLYSMVHSPHGRGKQFIKERFFKNYAKQIRDVETILDMMGCVEGHVVNEMINYSEDEDQQYKLSLLSELMSQVRLAKKDAPDYAIGTIKVYTGSRPKHPDDPPMGKLLTEIRTDPVVFYKECQRSEHLKRYTSALLWTREKPYRKLLTPFIRFHYWWTWPV